MKNPAGWNNPAQQRLDGLREAYRCRAYWQQLRGRHRFSPVVCIYHDASLVRYVPFSVQLQYPHAPLPVHVEEVSADVRLSVPNLRHDLDDRLTNGIARGGVVG